MAKIQFNCRLERDIVNWITREAQKLTTEDRKWSQADVVTLLVNRASVGLNGRRETGKAREKDRK